MARCRKYEKAGRPVGTGKFGEPTQLVRIPESMIDSINLFIKQRALTFPLYSDLIQAGFPTMIDDSPAGTLDIGAYLVKNPASTFFFRAAGDSMKDAGIFPDDLLIVDRSYKAANGDVVVAVIDGEFMVRRLFITQKKVELRPENRRYQAITVKDERELNIWGVVKNVIHRV